MKAKVTIEVEVDLFDCDGTEQSVKDSIQDYFIEANESVNETNIYLIDGDDSIKIHGIQNDEED